jgi:Fe-S-cluster containining protein
VSAPTEIYIAFPDGVFDYDCVKCGSLCCCGHGFGGVAGAEMGALLERHAELRHWVQLRDDGSVRLINPGDRCLFLESDGRCRVEAGEGRAAKPGVCRAFPFNRMHRIGETLAVSASVMCPLDLVVPARPGAVAGSHAPIEAELRATRMDEWPAQPAELHPHEDAVATVARERAFCDVCAAAIGSVRFADTLVSASADATALIAFGRRALALLGETPAEHERDAFDDIMHALAPAARLDLLALPPEGRLRALAIVDALVRGAFAGADRAPSVKGVASFVRAAHALVAVLALADEPFAPLADRPLQAKLPKFDRDELAVAGGAMIMLTRSGEGALAALEQALAPVSAPLERALFIRALDRARAAARRKTADGEASRA